MNEFNFFYLRQGLFSSVICPGLVMTNLTYGILPSIFWSLIMPIMYLVSGDCHLCFYIVGVECVLHFFETYFLFWAKQIRFFTNTFTLTPYNGAEALVCCQPLLLLTL